MATTQELKEKIKLLEEQLDRSKIVVYPKERKLKYFSGKSNENVEEWINDCKLAFCDRFSSGDQIKFVLSHLEKQNEKFVFMGPPLRVRTLYSAFCQKVSVVRIYILTPRKSFLNDVRRQMNLYVLLASL